MKEIQDLVDTMESLRSEHCAELPAALIVEVIRIQHGYIDEPMEASRRIALAIEKYLDQGEVQA